MSRIEELKQQIAECEIEHLRCICPSFFGWLSGITPIQGIANITKQIKLEDELMGLLK